jgi:hypothetical protein
MPLILGYLKLWTVTSVYFHMELRLALHMKLHMTPHMELHTTLHMVPLC